MTGTAPDVKHAPPPGARSAQPLADVPALLAALRARGPEETHRALGRMLLSPELRRRRAAIGAIAELERAGGSFATDTAPAVATAAFELLREQAGARAGRMLAAALWELTGGPCRLTPEVTRALLERLSPGQTLDSGAIQTARARVWATPPAKTASGQLPAASAGVPAAAWYAVGAGVALAALAQAFSSDGPVAASAPDKRRAPTPQLARAAPRSELQLQGPVIQIRGDRREIVLVDDTLKQAVTVRLAEAVPPQIPEGRRARVIGTSEAIGPFGAPIVEASTASFDSDQASWGWKQAPTFGPRRNAAPLAAGRPIRPAETPER